jgi:hypothetical protein
VDCGEFRRLASREADGVLDAAGRERLDRHVESCAGCLRFRDAVAACVSAHRRVEDVSPPTDLVSRIMAAAAEPRGAWFPGWMKVALPAAATATAVLGIWIGGLLIDRLAPADTQSQADVLELQYLNEYPPGSVGELLMASNGGGGDERK